MKFPENMKVVPVMNYGDMSSTIYSDSINMKNYHHCTFLIQLGTLGTADSVLTITSGASDATYTTAETFDYAFGGAATAAANCDVLAASTSAATLSLLNATYDDYMLIVEIDASAMTDGQEWLSVVLTDPGTATGNATIFAILEPRYSNVSSATALT